MRDLITSLTDMGIIASPSALKLLESQKNPMEMVRQILMGRGEILYLEEKDITEVLEEFKDVPEIPDSAVTIRVNPGTGDDLDGHTGFSGRPSLKEHDDADDSIGEGLQDKTPALFSPAEAAPSMSVPAGVNRYRPIAAEYADDFEVVGDITGKSLCEGKISDFSKYFRDRLSRLREMIKRRPEMRYARSIYKAKRAMDKAATIGIVTNVMNTDRGLSVELEDEEDSINVFISRDSPVFREIGAVVNDEVLGVTGSVRVRKRSAVIYPDAVYRPPLPAWHEPGFSEEGVSVAFVSDLHLGSKTFLTAEWKRVIEFLNGKDADTREIASRIKYLVLPGDVVDGIGVYPAQDEDLEITDLFMQYQALAEDLHSLPDHIRVIILPGNHDGVRMAEPQPALPAEVKRLFSGENITFAGNPITLLLHGVRILLYHGRSMDDLITTIPGLSYTRPIEAMQEMLIRRHLAPIYGGKTPLAPEHTDNLIINEVPDIFVTGHVHTTQLSSFHNIMLINASTWQDQTDYQKMRDIVPDPAKLPVVRLDTLTPEILSFR